MGRPYVADVKEGDIWYFPAGYQHSLQGLGPDGCEFVICFDAGDASEFNTLLVTDWFAHTPPAVLADNFGVPADTFAKTPLHNLWIFQGKVPGDLDSVRKAMTGSAGTPPEPFTFSLASQPNLNGTKSGTLHLADSSTFKVSKTIAAVVQTVPPGAMRAMHWHPNAVIMCKISATPTCSFSPCFGHRNFRKSPCQIGLHIPLRKWWRSI
jgi:oxalate decarboxylase